ncbi:M56 family metallopeptidase [Daejeonella lutea]|uniref:TonB family C-terminal domain-containing protein n=1 Tax=Daejeonella lutea TaxID=572036 RepID=A0A1T5ESI8_9SPHI|nr:M56 family metallopeptidase [Daejeonella lutea]SKB86911.1 TonB family C-terminal domain-containing protein [Daejeonella lutea]
MNGLNYLLQTNLYLLLFMGFYVLVLRNETFFRQNRFFLNTSIFLSFLIPFINSDWFRDLFITQKVREAAIMPSRMIYETVIVGIDEEASAPTAADLIFWTYVVGASLLTIRFLIRLAMLKSSLKTEKGSAFSFFKTLVVDRSMPKADTIIDHEKVHMRQWHSADIIFIELAAIINWFNPVMYLYKKEIRHIHEFIADEEAATLMQSKSDYALLLLSNTLGVDPVHLSNNFFNKSLLKRRIMMLHKNRSRSTGLWKYGFSAPLFMLMLIVSAATVQSEEVRPVAERILSPLTPETSEKIISALELNKPSRPDDIKPNDLVRVSETASATTPPDFASLKKHFMRTVKYPATARESRTQGFVVATFTVQNKEITGANIVRGLQTDANGEVLKTITSFRSSLEVPDDTYTLAVKYYFAGSNTPAEFVPDNKIKNYIGQIAVQAYHPDSTKKVSGANPTNAVGLNEVVVNDDNSIKDFASVEVLPEFEGGMNGWARYLQANLKYPQQARDKKTTGRVILAFVAEKDGTLSDIKVLRGLGDGLDEEAVRVVKNSPKWKPGLSNGRPARVAYTMPIFFQLAEKTDEKKPSEPVQPKP